MGKKFIFEMPFTATVVDGKLVVEANGVREVGNGKPNPGAGGVKPPGGEYRSEIEQIMDNKPIALDISYKNRDAMKDAIFQKQFKLPTKLQKRDGTVEVMVRGDAGVKFVMYYEMPDGSVVYEPHVGMPGTDVRRKEPLPQYKNVAEMQHDMEAIGSAQIVKVDGTQRYPVGAAGFGPAFEYTSNADGSISLKGGGSGTGGGTDVPITDA